MGPMKGDTLNMGGPVATYKNNPSLRRDCLFSGAEKETLAVLLLAALLLRLLGLLFLCHILRFAFACSEMYKRACTFLSLRFGNK